MGERFLKTVAQKSFFGAETAVGFKRGGGDKLNSRHLSVPTAPLNNKSVSLSLTAGGSKPFPPQPQRIPI